MFMMYSLIVYGFYAKINCRKYHKLVGIAVLFTQSSQQSLQQRLHCRIDDVQDEMFNLFCEPLCLLNNY